MYIINLNNDLCDPFINVAKFNKFNEIPACYPT